MSVYKKWQHAKEKLDYYKNEEMRLRLEICGDQLKDKIEGAKTVRVPGLKITATAKLNRTIDPAVLETIWEDLTSEEQECITYKPSLKLTNYKIVEQRGGKLLEAITVKPATPTLSIAVVEEA